MPHVVSTLKLTAPCFASRQVRGAVVGADVHDATTSVTRPLWSGVNVA